MELTDNKRQVVLSRLKKTAARLWGFQETDTEGFDPLVELLLEACASEFEKLSTEIHISQSRILERVAQTILPEVSLRPQPAHTVIHAKPGKDNSHTRVQDQITIEKEIIGDTPNNITTKKLFFSPTSEFKIVNCSTAIIATTQHIAEFSELYVKKTLCTNSQHKNPVCNSIWIGLEMKEPVSLNHVSFYFDWINNPRKEELLRYIPYSRWYINEKEVKIKKGFSSQVDDSYKNISTDIFNFLDINKRTEKDINEIYQERFITIDQNVTPKPEVFPESLGKHYNEEDISVLGNELCWIRIDMPEVFPPKELIETFCSANVFPVINRELHSPNRPHTLNHDLNIIPLDTDDYFFTIKEIISSNEVQYKEVPFKKIEDFASGTYTIRTEGVKRFDKRDAQEFLQYLMELLREEHVVFEAIGSSLIDKELKDLLIILNRLRLKANPNKTLDKNSHFIVMKSELIEDVWIEFWSTSGIFANNIQMGAVCNGPEYNGDNLKILQATVGGKNPPDKVDRTYLFKNELLTRDRVVTLEDIKLTCFSTFGSELEKVDIKRKPFLSTDRSKGFQNCIFIQLSFNTAKSETEKTIIEKHMKNVLENRSSCFFHYQIQCN